MNILYRSIFAVLFLLAFVNIAFSAQIPENRINKQAALNALVKYNQIITSKPNEEDGYINRAYINYILGNIKEAIADYDVLISINPQNEEFYLNRGYLKHISHKREEALKDYEEALKIKPDYAFAHNNRGVVLSELGRNSDSLVAYNTAIQINPNYADAYYNRGTLKTKTEKNEEALEDFDTAIKLNPSDSASYNNRGVAKRKLNYNIGALSDFSIAIKINPEDITALANRGRLKKRYFDSEGAEEDFKTAIAAADSSPVLVKEIEFQNQTIAEEKKQKESLSPSKTAKPTFENKKVTEDGIQKIAYKKPETNAVQASVMKLSPKQQTTVANKVENTTLQNTSLNKTPNITTTPVENPKLAECYFIRALQKYILQNRESALKDFNMAIQYNPQYAEAYYYRAAIKRDFKDDGFVDDYAKALQLNPNLKSISDADVLMILKM